MYSVFKKSTGLVVVTLAALLLSACSKEPVTITSAKMLSDLDKGSGNFDRVLQICFDQPLKSTYYHKVAIVTKENVKITGSGSIRPLLSDPDGLCHLRNIYLYIHKDSPPDARQLIKDYVVPGNIHQVLIQIYYEKPEGKTLPMEEKVFANL